MKYDLIEDIEDIRDYLFRDMLGIEKPLRSIDLRDKMPVLFNQLNENSCTANSGALNKEFLLGDKYKPLSRAFLYYMERFIEGTLGKDEGAQMRTICKALLKYGICEEVYMPYDVEKVNDRPSQEAMDNAKQYISSKYHRILTLNEVKHSLSHSLPVLFGMKVFDYFEGEEIQQTGILKVPAADEEYLGNHAVLCVGFNDDGKYLIVANSWGSDWDNFKGYFLMPYEYFNNYTLDKWVLEK